MQRIADVERNTLETQISLKINVDGSGVAEISTPIGFLNHMLTLWAKHGCFDLELNAKGDTEIDAHHTVEDIGICLGKALKKALGDKKGIVRFSHMILPMDEALVLVAVDFSGRGYLAFDAQFKSQKVGEFDTELVEEFFRALAVNGEITIHVKMLSGKNTHHIIEAMFKALGRAMRYAVAKDKKLIGIPSTKGVLV
ncbi:imidazoleglycerol-phosphate dehydratase HisB [Peptococcaceae bacterium]|nr:imidazoleglycerol-phosphate dehydratase HisB [Peptococcaceae bacterium]